MTPTQRAAMEQALEALEYLQGIVDTERGPKAAEALRAALAESERDWSMLEATQQSLREHMAEIQRLRQALEFTAQHKSSEWPERCQQMVDTARAALAEQPAEQEPEGSVCGRCGGLVFDPVLPQPAKRVPLTDDEIEEINGSLTGRRDLARLFARAVIAAYDAKNGITGEAE